MNEVVAVASKLVIFFTLYAKSLIAELSFMACHAAAVFTLLADEIFFFAFEMFVHDVLQEAV